MMLRRFIMLLHTHTLYLRYYATLIYANILIHIIAAIICCRYDAILRYAAFAAFITFTLRCHCRFSPFFSYATLFRHASPFSFILFIDATATSYSRCRHTLYDYAIAAMMPLPLAIVITLIRFACFIFDVDG